MNANLQFIHMFSSIDSSNDELASVSVQWICFCFLVYIGIGTLGYVSKVLSVVCLRLKEGAFAFMLSANQAAVLAFADCTTTKKKRKEILHG